MLKIRVNLEVDSVVYKDVLHGKFYFLILRCLDSRSFFLLIQIKCLLCFCIDSREILQAEQKGHCS